MISHQGIVETGTVVSETDGSVTGGEVSDAVVTGAAGFMAGIDAAVCAVVGAVTVSGEAADSAGGDVTAGTDSAGGSVVTLYILVVVSATDMGAVSEVTLSVSVTEMLSLVTEVSEGTAVSEVSEVTLAVEKLISVLSGSETVSEGTELFPDIPRTL